ncbi:MAG: ribbon-helix-helix protein, CopG family [Syntrophales bacterium]|nr:ribbon-helix-helix protein, CopG family [Syntrophales bacterium]MDP3097048.1 ribbon-helix-helix protein, CopG family [Syntrophales bacterium]
MVRMQVYLTKEDQSKIQWLACETGKTKSELVRQAIQRFAGQFCGEDRKSFLRQAKGLWKDRTDLPDFAAIRRELDRMSLHGR